MQNVVAIMQSGAQAQECPACHAIIPVHPEYVTWCDQCDWNLQPQEATRPRTLFDSLYIEIGKRSSQALFDEVAKAQSLKPRPTLSKALAFAVATIVHGVTFAVAILAVVLLIRGWPNIFAIIGGLVCAMLAWNMRPRISEGSGAIVSPAAFPTLYKISSSIAQALGTSPVDGIVIDDHFNASFGQFGWRRQKIMSLGLPLFSILSDQEKIALIAHELAHGVNSDPYRSFFVGTAIKSLATWHKLLHPDRLWDASSNRYRGRTSAGFVMLFANFFTNLFFLGLSVVPWLGAYTLSHLLWHESQRAEYQADHLAARVGGTESALSLLEKLHCGDTFALTVQRIALNRGDQSIFDELERRVAQMPRHELERISRLGRMKTARLDVSHPPTAYRIDFLKANPIAEPLVVMAPSDGKEMERELTTAYKRIQDRLIDGHRRRLYY